MSQCRVVAVGRAGPVTCPLLCGLLPTPWRGRHPVAEGGPGTGGWWAPTSDMWVLQMLFRTFGVASSRRRLEAWCSRVDRGMGQMGLVLRGGTFKVLALPEGHAGTCAHLGPLSSEGTGGTGTQRLGEAPPRRTHKGPGQDPGVLRARATLSPGLPPTPARPDGDTRGLRRPVSAQPCPTPETEPRPLIRANLSYTCVSEARTQRLQLPAPGWQRGRCSLQPPLWVLSFTKPHCFICRSHWFAPFSDTGSETETQQRLGRREPHTHPHPAPAQVLFFPWTLPAGPANELEPSHLTSRALLSSRRGLGHARCVNGNALQLPTVCAAVPGKAGDTPPTQTPVPPPLTCSGYKTLSRTFWAGPAPPRGGTQLHKWETATLSPARPQAFLFHGPASDHAGHGPTQLHARHHQGVALAVPIPVAGSGAWRPSLRAP